MYENVVVGVDGRPGGADAMALARRLAPGSTRVTLVHVRPLDRAPSRGVQGADDVVERERSTRLLQSERQSGAPDAEMTSVVAPSVGRGLHDVAEARSADLIVVGGCHRSAIGRVLVGNDARSVLEHAPCAVAIAPVGYAERPAPIQKIGVAYDGSSESTVALAHSALLADATGAELIIRDVVGPHVYGAAWGAGSTYVEDPAVEIAAERERLGAAGGAHVDVVVGFPHEELAMLSENVDVLVCGSRHQGAVKRVLLGSTSEYLSRHSACPLVVTPSNDEERVAAWRALGEPTAA
jgi:nucleotide-binding universal stress UspA family protein